MKYKNRSPQKTNKNTVDEKLADEFIAKADKTDDEIHKTQKELDPKATRRKQLGIKVNDFELELIEALAEKLDRSVTATIRYSINKIIKDELRL